jgi:hypothetical protein
MTRYGTSVLSGIRPGLSCEEYAPASLVRQAVLTEHAGFEALRHWHHHSSFAPLVPRPLGQTSVRVASGPARRTCRRSRPATRLASANGSTSSGRRRPTAQPFLPHDGQGEEQAGKAREIQVEQGPDRLRTSGGASADLEDRFPVTAVQADLPPGQHPVTGTTRPSSTRSRSSSVDSRSAATSANSARSSALGYRPSGMEVMR